MRAVKLKAHAKINLYLDILYRREDGYHQLQTVMQSVDLSDQIQLFLLPAGVDINCDHPELVNSQDNLAFKAATLLKDITKTRHGVKIELIKKIPVGAGLAGGSADAAAVLIGLNALWGINLSLTELQEIGAELGSDVPFCLEGGTLLGEGRGERLCRAVPLPDAAIVIAKPNFSLSTKQVYSQWDAKGKDTHPDLSKMLGALETGGLEEVCSNLSNVLEEVVFEEYPQVKAIKERALQAGASGVLMSGSGPSVFSIVKTKRKALEICEALGELCSFVITVPCSQGVEMI